MAKLTGIRQETLSRLESGKHKQDFRTFERIEGALKRARPKKRSVQRRTYAWTSRVGKLAKRV
ncbi:MAG: helix-turn-helix transcriptional regulator [Pirellulales bacterium]|nr:helix-turn-helix transcriptional regulator [Pirellulales bacterium]